MLLGRGAGNPLLRGSRGFRPVRGCRNHMNDLVAAAFELVENFGQREDGAGGNVVQQQDALAARLDTADGTSRNLATVDPGPVVRQEIRAPSHIAMGREVLLDGLLAQQTRYPKERRHRLRVPDGLAQRRKTLFDLARRLIQDRKSTRLNSSHTVISYAVFCLKKKKKKTRYYDNPPQAPRITDSRTRPTNHS